MSKGQGYKSAILVAESVAKQDYMDNYEVRVAEIERKKAERQADIKRVIHEYTTFVMTEFLSMYLANLHTPFLCNLIYPTFSRMLLYSC